VRNLDQRRPPLPLRLTGAEREFYLEPRRLTCVGACPGGIDLVTKIEFGELSFFSKSQWARWLNGESQPPRKAVRELAESLAKEDLVADLLVKLWDRAFAPDAAMAADAIALKRPRQLPASAQQFIGRADQLAALATLADPAVSSDGRAVISIEGTAGVRKTSPGSLVL
jgi:hypothetical protein